MEIKLAFKLVKTAGHCSTVHGEFLIVLNFLVTTWNHMDDTIVHQKSIDSFKSALAESQEPIVPANCAPPTVAPMPVNE